MLFDELLDFATRFNGKSARNRKGVELNVVAEPNIHIRQKRLRAGYDFEFLLEILNSVPVVN